MSQSSEDEIYAPTGIINIPGNPLKSFDISYVDVLTHKFLLADRWNSAIDVADTLSNIFVSQLIANPPFAGVVSTANASGPNGVILINGLVNLCNSESSAVSSRSKSCRPQLKSLVWAADGPTENCSGPCDGTSTVKVIDLSSGQTVRVLPTNGNRRPDELCYNPDPRNPHVLVANHDPMDNFVTFFRWDNFQNVGAMSLAGSDQDAANFPAVAAGIEQCKFNERNSYFYLAIPTTDTESGDGSGNGYVLKIAQPTSSTQAFVAAAYEIDGQATGCAGPQGLAIGPPAGQQQLTEPTACFKVEGPEGSRRADRARLRRIEFADH
jgi:hypothetical protein